MWLDSHCHLDAPEFDPDRPALWQAARHAGVLQAVIPAVEVNNFDSVAACCAAYPGCAPAYGIHPLYTDTATEADLEQLAARLQNGFPVAVGEIGLDHFIATPVRDRQAFFFTEQLKLAREYQLPVILHLRHAVDEVLKYLRRIPVPGGIAHAFNGSLQQASMLAALGFKLGFGGTLSYTGSRRIRHLAQTLPLDMLVLETDSPDIRPAWLPAGERNTPSQIPRIGQVLAELRGQPLAEIAASTCANTYEVLPRLRHYAPKTGGDQTGSESPPYQSPGDLAR